LNDKYFIDRMKVKKSTIAIFILTTIFFSCTDEETPNFQNSIPEPVVTPPVFVPNTVENFTYLALGDSYTIGQGVDEIDRWPIQLKGELKKDYINLTAVDIIAQTGWTTGSLLNAINNEKPEKHDLVSLLIGVNNQYQGRPFTQFENEFMQLLNIAINLCSQEDRLFVVSIPDYSITIYGSGNSSFIASEINKYNDYMEQQCLLKGIPFIDVTAISRDLGVTNGALAPDALHPSGYQYSKWVEVISPEVLKLLKN